MLHILALVFLLIPRTAFGQDTTLNKYGLWVISSTSILQKTINVNTNKSMIDIEKYIPTIVLDLRYATTNNFMKTKLYPTINYTFLRKPAAEALKKVQTELNKQGLGIKIFDAYRPYSVTEKMWEPIKDVNVKSGEEINMGTGFDNFSDTAHGDFINLPPLVLQNRLLLKSTMENYGFKVLDTEWWHFYLPNAKEYELLDVPFKKLKSIRKSID